MQNTVSEVGWGWLHAESVKVLDQVSTLNISVLLALRVKCHEEIQSKIAWAGTV